MRRSRASFVQKSVGVMTRRYSRSVRSGSARSRSGADQYSNSLRSEEWSREARLSSNTWLKSAVIVPVPMLTTPSIGAVARARNSVQGASGESSQVNAVRRVGEAVKNSPQRRKDRRE